MFANHAESPLMTQIIQKPDSHTLVSDPKGTPLLELSVVEAATNVFSGTKETKQIFQLILQHKIHKWGQTESMYPRKEGPSRFSVPKPEFQRPNRG